MSPDIHGCVLVEDPYPDNGVALAAANAEIERGRATVAEQAVALHLHAGKARWD